MSKRIRLTDRRRQAVDSPGTPYPGNVNLPERQFKEHAQYDNWKEVVNHPLPDMRHEWQDNPRDEIGFGIPKSNSLQPTLASVHVAADKAVRASVLLLGEKVAETVIEEQARDFMLMGGEALDRTLGRFQQTQKLYVAADDDDDDDDDDEDEEDGKKASVNTAADDAEDDDEDGKKAADDAEEGDDEDNKEASTELATATDAGTDTVPEQPAESTGSQDGKQKGASEQFDADVQTKIAELKVMVEAQASNREAYNQKVMEAAKKALAGEDSDDADEKKEDDKKASTPLSYIDIPERVAGPNEMDIELTATMDSEVQPDPAADAMLAGLFDDGTPAELPEPGMGSREASAKQGIKTLGGQPKVAGVSAGGPVDISDIWASAPDVSEIFN